MNRLSDIESMLPKMKSGDELMKSLEIKPDYDESIRIENMAVRLMKLSDIYNIYVPSRMTEEIYYKLYLALVYSMRKKTTKKQYCSRMRTIRLLWHRNIGALLEGQTVC